MPGQRLDVLFEAGKPLVGSLNGVVDLDEGRSVAGNHRIDRQPRQDIERLARCLETAGVFRVPEQLGKDDAEAVAPQSIARDQQASLGVVEGQRVQVVTGYGDRRIVAKARRRLTERREQQGLFVPFGSRLCRGASRAARRIAVGRFVGHLHAAPFLDDDPLRAWRYR